MKRDALPWASARPVAGSAKAEAAVEPERREGNVFEEVGYPSSDNCGIECPVGPGLRFQLCFCQTLGNFS